MKNLSKKEITEDLKLLQKNLENIHPNTYEYISKEDFSEEISRLSCSCDNISSLGLGIKQLLAQLRDGHTSLSFSKSVLGEKSFMFKFQFLQNGYYLTSATESLSQYLGSKLKGINNYNVEEIEEKLQTFIPQQNEISTRYYLSSRMVEPKILEYLEIKKNEYITLHLETKGRIQKIQVFPEDYSKKMVSIEEKTPNMAETLLKKDINWHKVIPEHKAFYLQYNNCEEDKNFKMKDIVEKVKESKMSTIIIDLRNNKGGDSDVINPLLEFLKEKEAKYKIIVLTGSDTYSSAILNLLDLSSLRNSISVGEIPHGNPTHYGEIESFSLPNSGFEIFCSSKLFTFDGYELGESFKPTYIVNTEIESLTKGVDQQMEFVYEMR